MAERRASLMEPRMEELLDKVDSKFTLVTLSAMRAREINDYYNQLGEGLGKIVPPQVTSVSRQAADDLARGDRARQDRGPASSRARGRRVGGRRRRGRPRELARVPDEHAGVGSRRRIVLGVAGGIAAYKAVEVCRRLVDAGAFVSPVLTEDAQRFVGALTFSALASEPARTSLFGPDGRGGGEPIPHTRLGQRADLVIVAPATAKLLGKYAAGISDDLLTATLLATRAPVLVAPAMHTEMWEHPAVQENLATLRRRGVHVVDPESGRLAGGDSGEGRLAAPERIVAAATEILRRRRRPAGRPGRWSPPAGPASRSTPCGSSRTARRASRATRSPRRRPVAGPT